MSRKPVVGRGVISWIWRMLAIWVVGGLVVYLATPQVGLGPALLLAMLAALALGAWYLR